MRRWRRIEDVPFKKGTILVLIRDDDSCAPYMNTDPDGDEIPSETRYMVEIDEYGNTIRTYNNTLNEGTLVGGSMNKLKKLEEQHKKLGEEIQALKKEEEFVPGWYMYWNSTDSYRALRFIEDEVSLDEKKGAWVHVEPVTQELLWRNSIEKRPENI